MWEICRKRSVVEAEAAVQRSVNNLPRQLSVEDHAMAREVYERKLGKRIPDYKTPSENYFESKVGEAETMFKAEMLAVVTNISQEERQKTPQQLSGSAAITFDSRGHPTVKTQRKDF